jgi:hypothetical protein
MHLAVAERSRLDLLSWPAMTWKEQALYRQELVSDEVNARQAFAALAVEPPVAGLLGHRRAWLNVVVKAA